MWYRMFSATIVLSFKLLSLALILTLLLFRMDFLSAQEGVTEDTPMATPGSIEIKDEADDDDADGDDPPTDNDGYDTPPGEEDERIVYTIRPGDTLMRLAIRLGIPYAVLKAQTDNPSMIHPGQKFYYRGEDRIDSSIPLTDDDGTDSDGYDTPPPTTDFDGISTPPPTSNDGTDSDGYDTTGYYTDNDGVDTPIPGIQNPAQLQQQQQQQRIQQLQQQQSYTDNDGIDTTGIYTSNDGTDSDGIDTTGAFTDNDGTDSDGYDTTGALHGQRWHGQRRLRHHRQPGQHS